MFTNIPGLSKTVESCEDFEAERIIGEHPKLVKLAKQAEKEGRFIDMAQCMNKFAKGVNGKLNGGELGYWVEANIESIKLINAGETADKKFVCKKMQEALEFLDNTLVPVREEIVTELYQDFTEAVYKHRDMTAMVQDLMGLNEAKKSFTNYASTEIRIDRGKKAKFCSVPQQAAPKYDAKEVKFQMNHLQQLLEEVEQVTERLEPVFKSIKESYWSRNKGNHEKNPKAN